MAKFLAIVGIFAILSLALGAPASEEKGVEKKDGDLSTASSFYGGYGYGYPGFGYGYGYGYGHPYGGFYGGYGYPIYRSYGFGPFYGGYYG